jgi:hypothetical protein
MADNLIEQFFIDIELNTKGVGKQAKQIDKILDGLGNRAIRRAKVEKVKMTKANKTYLADLLKEEDKAAKIKQAKEKNISDAKTKHHVKAMTQQNVELKKMKEFYKAQEKAAERAAKRQKVIDNQLARIQGTAWYNKFKGAGGDTHGFEKDLRSAMKDGDAARVTNLTNQMKRLTAEQERYNRKLQKTNIIQKGVTDSTRNMIRSYASLYALFEGTVAIKRVGQEYQGLDASMLAAAGSSEAAAKDFEFINGLVDKMGLSLKDTSDAWVKFKFAAKGKISQEQQEDVFTGLSMFGTSLKVDSESMKRSQKALIQIDDYCLAA